MCRYNPTCGLRYNDSSHSKNVLTLTWFRALSYELQTLFRLHLSSADKALRISHTFTQLYTHVCIRLEFNTPQPRVGWLGRIHLPRVHGVLR